MRYNYKYNCIPYFSKYTFFNFYTPKRPRQNVGGVGVKNKGGTVSDYLSVCALTRKRCRRHRCPGRYRLTSEARGRRLRRFCARSLQVWAAADRGVVAVVGAAAASSLGAAAPLYGAAASAAVRGPPRPRPPASQTGPRRRQWPRSTRTPVPAA